MNRAMTTGALTRVRISAENATAARIVRDATIRDAATQHTLAEVAEAAGLTRARIHQIVKADQ